MGERWPSSPLTRSISSAHLDRFAADGRVVLRRLTGRHGQVRARPREVVSKSWLDLVLTLALALALLEVSRLAIM